ncbi:hypothetical protein KVT40_002550 [Elsinoe batatas]|uniref:Uncharacterized protein n=1 Tax=Elsinoe batatas TaxID=2601811 RepID=A0A8K0L4C2_9PEZI|nr:hypothetical protein KVT40_002550 [Elsinoe batatas]
MQQELFQEIDRVVNSSYPTQLQTLANILVRADDLDIETWSLSRPHQIQPLIEDVLAALPVWSYCLDIISRLATVRSTRDALLSIEPALLPGIVDKAIEHFDTDGRYLPEAVALLRYNLPDETPVPASVQILLVKVSAKAASKLDSRSVGLLDVLLSGSCKALTRSFSSDGLRRLEENVFKILRDASDVEQQFLALVCLSIMKNLLSSSTSAAMRAFFDAQKAHKTLQLVVLQVIWSCTAQGDHRKVATAINVVEGVPETVRWQWSEKNASVIRKLIEKLGQGDLPSSLRLQVWNDDPRDDNRD